MRVEVSFRESGVRKVRYVDLKAFSIPLMELRELLSLFLEDVEVKPAVAIRSKEV